MAEEPPPQPSHRRVRIIRERDFHRIVAVLREVAKGPYYDSDCRSLLLTLQARARKALKKQKP